MDFEGTVDPRMIEALRGAKRIILKFGSKAMEMDSLSFETMVHTGAVAIASERPERVTIYAYNSDNKRRWIDFDPSTGEYSLDVDSDEWEDTRFARINLEIIDPSDEEMWAHVDALNLTFESNSRNSEWEFRGRYCDLVRFLKDYYVGDDEEVYYSYIETIRVDR